MILVAAPSAAADAVSDRAPSPDAIARHIRTTDGRLHALLHEGLRSSPTLSAIVHRLLASDVVVYLQCDGATRSHIAGKLTFLVSAGGYRYVVVRLSQLHRRENELAILAHELQHAVEVADTPAIVDGPSLMREYRRFGFENRWSSAARMTFDTHRAVETGNQVLRELTAPSGD